MRVQPSCSSESCGSLTKSINRHSLYKVFIAMYEPPTALPSTPATPTHPSAPDGQRTDLEIILGRNPRPLGWEPAGMAHEDDGSTGTSVRGCVSIQALRAELTAFREILLADMQAIIFGFRTLHASPRCARHYLLESNGRAASITSRKRSICASVTPALTVKRRLLRRGRGSTRSGR